MLSPAPLTVIALPPFFAVIVVGPVPVTIDPPSVSLTESVPVSALAFSEPFRLATVAAPAPDRARVEPPAIAAALTLSE